MAHENAGFGYAVGIGSAAGYPNDGVPNAALVAPDGKVAFIGHPADLTGNTIKRLLEKVRKPTPEVQEARARAMLGSAEDLVADGRLLRAEVILRKAIAAYGATESGKRAAARVAEIAAGEFKAEYDAQTELAKLIGGVERPAQKLDPKLTDRLAKTLDAKAADWRASAPAAAAMAREWASIVANPWR